MIRILSCLIVLIFLFVNEYAQDNSQRSGLLEFAVPESAGFSSARLARLDDVFKEYVDNEWCQGGAALIARDSKIIYYKGFGYDDIEIKTPFKKDAIFRIASQTKAVTSVAVMMLFEEGKFLLDDPVSKYLPEFKGQRVIDTFNEDDSTYTTVEAKHQVTIRELLTHTSGLGYPLLQSKAMNAIFAKSEIIMGITEDKILLSEQMKKLGALPLAHQPGEKYTYGLSTDVLGYLVEVVSGMSLNQFFHERIFKPLGMNDTYFYLPKEKFDRLATLYSEDSTKHLIKIKPSQRGFNPDYPKTEGTYFSGGGGLVSTAYDYSLFLQMLANGGEYNGKRMLGLKTIKMMSTNQIGDLVSGSLYVPRGGGKFGLGFEVISEAGSKQILLSEGTYGWGGTFGSLYWIDPKEKIIAQLVIQKAPNSYETIRAKFITLIYQALEK
ncbi:MAG: serine hydrolase domain-containing protein [Bacteroidota bacterium]